MKIILHNNNIIIIIIIIIIIYFTIAYNNDNKPRAVIVDGTVTEVIVSHAKKEYNDIEVTAVEIDNAPTQQDVLVGEQGPVGDAVGEKEKVQMPPVDPINMSPGEVMTVPNQ